MELKSLRLAELNQMRNNKLKNDRCSLYFEDGVRKIDLIIAYKNCSDENENRAKNETRQRFLQEIQENGLQFEEVYNCNSKKKTRNTLVTFSLTVPFLSIRNAMEVFQIVTIFTKEKNWKMKYI